MHEGEVPLETCESHKIEDGPLVDPEAEENILPNPSWGNQHHVNARRPSDPNQQPMHQREGRKGIWIQPLPGKGKSVLSPHSCIQQGRHILK